MKLKEMKECTCNECLFLIEKDCLQCQKPIAITIPETVTKPKLFCINFLTWLILLILLPLYFIEFLYSCCFDYKYDFYFTYQIQEFCFKKLKI